MVCCVARVHDSVQDDLKYDEVQEDISRWPEDKLQTCLQDDKVQEDISRQAETNKGQNDTSRQVEGLQDDEERNDISRQPKVDLQDDKVQEDISRQAETDEGQNDTSRQAEDDDEQNDISRQPEVDLQDDEVQEDTSRQMADDLQDNIYSGYGIYDERENNISRQPEDAVPDDTPQQPEDELKDDVKDNIPQKLDGAILSALATKDDRKDNIDYSSTLINLPTELLVKILLYLPICARMMVRHISQRFRNVAEIPLLWKEFTVDIGSPLNGIMANLLKVIGEHVRVLYIGTWHPQGKTLSMLCNTNWRNVTHLILDQRYYPSCLRGLIQQMPHLQNLELMLSLLDYYTTNEDMGYDCAVEEIVEMLKIIEGRIRKLDCSLEWSYDSFSELKYIVEGIQECANKGYVLPSIINIFSRVEFYSKITATDNSKLYSNPRATCLLFKFWSTSAFSFEIGFYDIGAMNIFPSVSVIKYKFGAAEATPILIQLSDHGIVNLRDEIIPHLIEWVYQ